MKDPDLMSREELEAEGRTFMLNYGFMQGLPTNELSKRIKDERERYALLDKSNKTVEEWKRLDELGAALGSL